MSTTFPRTRRSRLGYNVEQVEDFLEEARRAYSAEPGELTIMTAVRIRRTAFAMEKGGYLTIEVDAALERLEDAFSRRERDSRQQERGNDFVFAEARSTAQVILDRLARPPGSRFARVAKLTNGYNRGDVDRFADRLGSYFQDWQAVTVDEVRTAAFRPQRGGYRETQVDLVLDAVVDVMLAVRT